MNTFKVLTTVAFLIVILGAAVMYRASIVQRVGTVEQVTDGFAQGSVSDANEPAYDVSLTPGTYIIYQTTRVSDPDAKDWINDDTQEVSFFRWKVGEEAPVRFFIVGHGPEFDGSLTTNGFGQDLLAHRFSMQGGKQMDGVISLMGMVLETRTQKWGVIRSKNGRYEVAFTSPYDNPGVENPGVNLDYKAVVTDLKTGKQSDPLDLSLTSVSFKGSWAEPYLIDNEGKYLYAREMFGGEGDVSGLWEVNVQTGKARQLGMLIKADNWGQVTLDAESRRAIIVKTGFVDVDCEMGGCREGAPPSSVELFDLETGAQRVLFTDEDAAYGAARVDPTNPDHYLLASGRDGLSLTIRSLTDSSFKKVFVFDGAKNLQDFLGNAIVYSTDTQTLMYNLETDATTVLGKQTWNPADGPRQLFDYIGSITIE